ncbi:tau 95 subunit of transcription factor TFIIIC [Friedmanniomyces endolithicus]|uniref:Transcription factor IIIC subunit 5 HTH domain-containing protein n=2 Tax=Friedmanniomyces endolithicus TaxID=329885 RepID=A0A4U0VEQ9_9PEZI|nr:tau 95 subunit of transcription factor TFIIIC [Friedmanniomyces endolithicus]KAK0797661.1 tau 95 subunit of transcription factor TFIIIC [Friedmanniomyces endolithicus]KAK0857972.1 tau 95 subunit of transcription factor TFIIIC [Friedmanniomyces endolithicus]KAK0900845.1 tau 95 subunit of transcription factor TFIIIC [Friedmanniomyces endolithicus]KAK1038097.1 tau 95 subunit of transcription factor TFIIIC [Friedmanniomyces endolithicus]
MVSMSYPRDGQATGGPGAPSYDVPDQRVVSIEHPCIVRNLDRGLKSLGGEAQIQHVLDHTVGDSQVKVGGKTNIYPEPVLGVSLRPDDLLAKKMSSAGVETSNILVRVTLPKWTGRKRKRGSDEPFAFVAPAEQQRTSIKAPALLRQLRDNEAIYQVQALGMIRETHRFRSQPDHQMHGGDLPLYREIRDHVLPPKYSSLQKFDIDLNPFTRGNAVYPLPPTMNAIDQPYQYKYRQAYGVVYKFDSEGNPICETSHIGYKRVAEPLAADIPTVPLGPPDALRKSGRQDELVLRAVIDLKHLLETRPLASKRVFGNLFPDYSEDILKEANQWAGYYFSAGPWRDLLIGFGVDPRTDPKYRFYQTLTFTMDKDVTTSGYNRGIPSTSAGQAGDMAHVFDGKSAPSKFKLWQVCDIVHPVLREMFLADEALEVCDVHQCGWYHPGTLAKARVIMKDIIRGQMLGLPTADSEYAVLAGLSVTAGEMEEKGWDVGLSGKVLEMARDVRSAVRGYGYGKGKGKVEEQAKGSRGDSEVRRAEVGGSNDAVVDAVDPALEMVADVAGSLDEVRAVEKEDGAGDITAGELSRDTPNEADAVHEAAEADETAAIAAAENADDEAAAAAANKAGDEAIDDGLSGNAKWSEQP